jgi:hypothetical protein
MLNNPAVTTPTPISIHRQAAPGAPGAVTEHHELGAAAAALEEAHTDMKYNRHEAAAAWAAIAQAHIALARELRESI